MGSRTAGPLWCCHYPFDGQVMISADNRPHPPTYRLVEPGDLPAFLDAAAPVRRVSASVGGHAARWDILRAAAERCSDLQWELRTAGDMPAFFRETSAVPQVRLVVTEFFSAPGMKAFLDHAARRWRDGGKRTAGFGLDAWVVSSVAEFAAEREAAAEERCARELREAEERFKTALVCVAARGRHSL